jgi:hypothetical protein
VGGYAHVPVSAVCLGRAETEHFQADDAMDFKGDFHDEFVNKVC